MSVLAAALFGSRARDDSAVESDTDVLLVTDEKLIRSSAEESLSLSFYPASVLLHLAADGDLFAGHIVLEAKVISDAGAFFDRLQSAWRIRTDYGREIAHASALGSFLLSPHGLKLDSIIWNKRTAWCVRTILVARTFEKGRPTFATAALARFAGTELVLDLIGIKSSAERHAEAAAGLDAFLRACGQPCSICLRDAELETYRLVFLESGNRIGSRTLRSGSATQETGYS